MRWAILLVGAMACVKPTASSNPARTVAAWTEALASDDPARGYALLSRKQQALQTQREFAQTWRATAAERAQAREQLQRAQTRAVAHVWSDSDMMELTWDGVGTWGLSQPHLVAGASTPRALVNRLADVLTSLDGAALIRLLTDERAEPARDQFAGLRLGLARRDTLIMEFVDESTRVMRWDAAGYRYVLHLVMSSSGTWRLSDLIIRPLDVDDDEDASEAWD